MTLVRRILAVIGLVACFTSAGIAAEPDFGLKVLVFDPSQTDIQQRINTVFKEQERAGRLRFSPTCWFQSLSSSWELR